MTGNSIRSSASPDDSRGTVCQIKVKLYFLIPENDHSLIKHKGTCTGNFWKCYSKGTLAIDSI